MDGVSYKELYRLQDKVLKIVFKTEKEFYLTGGTCLSRFYFEKRYSDDLDFFAQSSNRFHFAIKNILCQLKKNFSVITEVDSKDFIRLKINTILQLDFVNETLPHFKDVIIVNEYFIIDNLDNILSNKLCAVIGRDNPKDIFDIFLISKMHTFSWKEILTAAHEKAYFSDDDLIIRLKTFPRNLLKNIKLLDKNFLNDFDETYKKILNEIIRNV